MFTVNEEKEEDWYNGALFLGRDEELNEFSDLLDDQLKYCSTVATLAKYPIIFCANFSGLGKTTFGETAFYQLQRENNLSDLENNACNKDQKSNDAIKTGLQNGKKIFIDFNGGDGREFATEFEKKKIRNSVDSNPDSLSHGKEYGTTFATEIISGGDLISSLSQAFLIIRLLARYFGYHIITFIDRFNLKKEEYWNTFMQEGCLLKVLLKICDKMTKNSILYVHIDEPQLLVEQLMRGNCNEKTSIDFVKMLYYHLCSTARDLYSEKKVYLCVIVTSTISYPLDPMKLDTRYLGLSPIDPKLVIEYLSLQFSAEDGFAEVVKKPIFTAILHSFGVIPYLLPFIRNYFGSKRMGYY